MFHKLFQINFIVVLLFVFLLNKQNFCAQQIANYVSNGSFEQTYSNCPQPNYGNVAKSWSNIDSLAYMGNYCSSCPNIGWVPYNGNTFQYPRTGIAYLLLGFLCKQPTCGPNLNRGYLKNRLKANLQAGKTYCVKYFVNICNTSTYGMDGFGAYFGGNLIDTITKCTIPLTYINPQVQNTTGNIITDTLNWVAISGTFVATGIEKYMLLGNFKADNAVNMAPVNLANLPLIFTDICVDDASCIDIDLPAYAGPDTHCIPGNSVYIGRPQDVGIDEACTWYNLTNTVTPIGNGAGIAVFPITTQTYIVKQIICGNIKWDTVVVHQTALGLAELKMKSEELKISPNPANDILNLSFVTEGLESPDSYRGIKAEIINSLGQLLSVNDLNFINKNATINISDLPNGVYVLIVKSASAGSATNASGNSANSASALRQAQGPQGSADFQIISDEPAVLRKKFVINR